MNTQKSMPTRVWSGKGRESFDIAFKDVQKVMENLEGYLKDMDSLLQEYAYQQAEERGKEAENFRYCFEDVGNGIGGRQGRPSGYQGSKAIPGRSSGIHRIKGGRWDR